MKQSTKLLSMILAIVMALGCLSVVGNAALVKGEVEWDCIDDAYLDAEQVADLALDLVDNDLLAGIETVDLSILGELRLNKIDHIFEDITKLRDSFAWTIGSGLLGDLGDLDFDPLLQSGSYGLLSSHTAYQRSHGDLNVVGALLELLGNSTNSDIISNAAYGIGTDNGISLGLVGNFLDLGDIGDMLGDIPGLLKGLVFDLLVYGSDGYDKSIDDIRESNSTLTATYPDMDTLDEMVNNALLNVLIKRQDYTWEGEGDAAVKVWEDDSILVPALKDRVETEGREAVIGELSPLTNSFFTILDNFAQLAIDEIAVAALNNNLKKALMKAVEMELNELDYESLPADVKVAFDAEDEYVTYFAYDRMMKSNNAWYYTTLETEVEEDANGDPVLDEEGNEISTRVRKYFKVNTAAANEFGDLINWDWEFVKSTSDDAIFNLDDDVSSTNCLNYDALIEANGSIIGSLNDILGIVFNVALDDEIKADFADVTGSTWEMGSNEDYLNDNVVRVTKYLLVNFGDRIFGTDSAYANYEWDQIADLEILDLVALIGPEFFADVMPQLILPKNADGTYAFHDDVQVLEFGASVIREFASDVAPSINYDGVIYAEGNVTSANDRQFAVHTAEEWFNIILNMGIGIGGTYLNQITNFSDFCKDFHGTDFDLEGYLMTGGGTDAAHWQKILDTAILWAVDYVGGERGTAVLEGFEYNTIVKIDGPLNKLSYILDKLLPLGFVCGYTSASYDLDLNLVFDGIKKLFTEFDLNVIFNLFGRNTESKYNMLDDAPLVQAVLKLVNRILKLVFRVDLLQDVEANSLDAVVDQASLKQTILLLLRNLYGNKDAILLNALPVVGKLIKGWGTEQAYQTPDVSLERAIDLTNGATTADVTVNVRNASNGVWRHYRDEAGNPYTDNQYEIKMTSVEVYDGFTDNASTYVTASLPEANKVKIGYGASGSFTYTAANVPTTGALVRFEIKYIVYDESGSEMAGGKPFTLRAFAWLNYNGSNEEKWIEWNNDGSLSYANLNPNHYVPLSSATDYIPEMVTGSMGRDYKMFTSSQEAAITAATATADGLTFGNVSMKFSNVSGGRYFNGLTQFKSYTVQATNDDGEEQSGSGNALTVNGSVNKAAWEAANKTSGSKTTFSITLKAKGKNNGPHNLVLNYYDDVYQSKLASLAAGEMDAVRMASDYNMSGKAYADDILTSVNSTDKDGEKVLRQSNYSTLVWIDSDENVYQESQLIDIEETTDPVTGKVVAATATYVDGDKKIPVKKVTEIDCNGAVTAYGNAALAGFRGGMQAWNDNSVYNFEALYDALEVASNDIEYCKKTAEQLVAEGNGGNIDVAVNNLKDQLDTVEATYTDDYDFTDYKMHRLNRLNDAREDAAWFINLKDDAKNNSVEEIDEKFPYTSINEDDLRVLVAGDDYENIILALLEPMDEEERANTAKWLADRKVEYQSQQLIDVEMAANYLELTSNRLLKRGHGVITTYLADEITSAENMVGAEADYTYRSWAKYEAALETAKAVLAEPTQKTAFDAKYELMCARNELVKVADEADYSELEALIEQATYALENQDLYENEAVEFGRVLAALGYNSFTNENGDEVQLFPGSAIYYNTEPYAVDEQGEIDGAADRLKEALAKLKFKQVSVTGNGVTVENSVLVEGDEDEGIEDIIVKTARIAECLDADKVKALFSVTAEGMSNVLPENITVSNDYYYTVDTDLEGFAGTGATVTFYTVIENTIRIPVATVKIIVNGDINGDGVVDALDGAYAALVAADKTELKECYLLAGDLVDDGKRVVNADDYGAIINLVVG